MDYTHYSELQNIANIKKKHFTKWKIEKENELNKKKKSEQLSYSIQTL